MSEPMTDENEKALLEIERQLERSGFFAHTSLSNQAERINEIESFLYGLIDTLIEQGVIDKDAFTETVKKVRQESLQKEEHSHAGVAISTAGAADMSENNVLVNCEERIHICKNVCCKLNFALSVDEIESGNIKWDLGQPYFIRQNQSGYCSHMDNEKHCCSIYGNRPGVCRKYSCAKDARIWKDFEKMELNREWIEVNLKENKIHLQAIRMIPDIEYNSGFK